MGEGGGSAAEGLGPRAVEADVDVVEGQDRQATSPGIQPARILVNRLIQPAAHRWAQAGSEGLFGQVEQHDAERSAGQHPFE